MKIHSPSKLLLLSLLSSATLLAQSTPDFSVRFDQKAFVRVTYYHNPRNRLMRISTSNVLPTANESAQVDTLAAGAGSHLLAVDVRNPQRGYWQVDRVSYDLYLIPNDTINLAIDFQGDTVWHDKQLTFTGDHALYQQFYRQRNLALPKLALKRALSANNAPSLAAYQQVMDSLWHLENQFFVDYPHRTSFPAWFIDDETRFLAYRDASYRENAILLRRLTDKNQPPETVPATYFAYHSRAPISNPAAQHLSVYWQLVRDYISLQSKRPIGQSFDDFWIKINFDQADRILPTSLAEFYKVHVLSSLARANPSATIATIQQYAPIFAHKQWVDVILADAKARIRLLKTGDQAPLFFLPNVQDSLISSKSFRGNVVLLCFWFAGCKPCIEEFAHENKLVETFQNDPVRIVSICTISSERSWLKTIQQYHLQTINLYANPSWQQKLESLYGITGYPRYVLIDQQGRISNNFAPKPSAGLEADIRALLR